MTDINTKNIIKNSLWSGSSRLDLLIDFNGILTSLEVNKFRSLCVHIYLFLYSHWNFFLSWSGEIWIIFKKVYLSYRWGRNRVRVDLGALHTSAKHSVIPRTPIFFFLEPGLTHSVEETVRMFILVVLQIL